MSSLPENDLSRRRNVPVVWRGNGAALHLAIVRDLLCDPREQQRPERVRVVYSGGIVRTVWVAGGVDVAGGKGVAGRVFPAGHFRDGRVPLSVMREDALPGRL